MILFYKLRSIYHDFIHAGLKPSDGADFERTQKIRFSQFLLLSAFSLLPVGWCFVEKGNFSSQFFLLLALVGLLLARFFQLKQFDLLAKLIATISLLILPLGLAWGNPAASGALLLFFPYSLLLGSILLQNSKWEVLLFFGLLTLAFCFSMISGTMYFTHLSVLKWTTVFFLTLLNIGVMARWNSSQQAWLEEEKAMGDLLFNSSFDAVLVLKSATHTIKQCNGRALELMEAGPALESLQGRKLESLLEHSYRASVPWEQINGTAKTSWQGELAFLTLEGNIFPAYVSFVPFEYKKTEFVKLSILDLSHLKNAEFDLIRAKEEAVMATNAKSRFLSHMSHEIRTPLTSVLETVRLIISSENKEAQEQQLHSLELLSEQLLDQVNDVLDFNKMDAGKLELDLHPFSPAELFSRLVQRFQLQAKKKGIVLQHQLKNWPEEALVIGDEHRLNQVLSNLVSNAIKFTASGQVLLKLSLLKQQDTGWQLLFEVEDTGIGIAPEYLATIFEPFSQENASTAVQYGGSGLGMALASSLVHSMGGCLKVESQLSEGSRFYFELLLSKPTKGHLPIIEKEESYFYSGSILLVDDHAVNRSVAERLLNKLGLQVTVAESGAAALQVLQTKNVDLVMTDLEMPDMDGYVLLKELKFIRPEMKVVAFSAAVSEKNREELLAQGFDEVLNKPFRVQDLRDRLGRVL